MRTILNISLPENLAHYVEKNIESGNYATKSEFIRVILRFWMENNTLMDIKASRSELNSGKGKILKSLKDLR